jgi:hypothetical protein
MYQCYNLTMAFVPNSFIMLKDFVLSIHDMWTTGDIDGDTDDWVAVLTASKKRDLVVYVPGARFLKVQKFVKDNGIDLRLIGPGHPEVEWCALNATSICKCAPLSKADSVLVDAIRRRKDNSSNAAQGQTFDPTVKGPNYNFKATMNNLGISKEQMDSLFPNQYPSDLTKQTCRSLLQELPPVIQEFVSAFAVLKVVCPPPAHLPFAVGLLDPAKGKGSNAIECMKMLCSSGANGCVKECDDTTVFFANLVKRFRLQTDSRTIQNYVTASKTDRPEVLANALAGVIHLAQQRVRINGESMYSDGPFAPLSSITNAVVSPELVIDPPLYDAVALLACVHRYDEQKFIQDKPSIDFLLSL